MKIYCFHNYTVFRWDSNDHTSNPYRYKWYINLKGKDTVTRIGFATLACARKWCKQNYLIGVMNGWINA